MLDEQFKAKLLHRLDINEVAVTQSVLFAQDISFNGSPLAQVRVFERTCRAFLRQDTLANLEKTLEKHREKTDSILWYYQQYHSLSLSKDEFEELLLDMCVCVIEKREAAILAYLARHFAEMCNQTLRWISDEAHLAITDDSDLVFGYDPAFGRIINAYPPLSEDVERELIEPFEEALKKRLGCKKGRRTGRLRIAGPQPQGISALNMILGYVPVYRIYKDRLKQISKGEIVDFGDSETFAGERLYMNELAAKEKEDLRYKACRVLIEKFGAPYNTDSLESLYQALLPALRVEEEIIERFKSKKRI